MKIAFVVHRYGTEIRGGHELLCRMFAERLVATGEECITVFTTTAIDYLSWESYYIAGNTTLNGVNVSRFPIQEERNITSFNSRSKALLEKLDRGLEISVSECLEWMHEQGPDCPELVQEIEERQNAFDLFVFFSYLYYPSFFGPEKVSSKPCLVFPAFHREWMLQLPIWDSWIQNFQGFLFNTPEELSLARERFGSILANLSEAPTLENSSDGTHLEYGLIGSGIEEPANPIGDEIRTLIKDPYILFLGRIDESKGVYELIDLFIKMKYYIPSNIKLVLMGSPAMYIPESEDILIVENADDSMKWSALKHCELLVNPSPYESLSLVLLEAWYLKKPVLVTRESDVMVGQCKRSGGGLTYSNYEEFFQNVYRLMRDEKYGLCGYNFWKENYQWDKVLARFREVARNVLNS